MNNKSFVRMELVLVMAIVSAMLVVILCLSGCTLNQYVKDDRVFGGVLPDCQYPISEWSPVRSTACGGMK